MEGQLSRNWCVLYKLADPALQSVTNRANFNNTGSPLSLSLTCILDYLLLAQLDIVYI